MLALATKGTIEYRLLLLDGPMVIRQKRQQANLSEHGLSA
jgi:hypothetical protein